MSRVLLGTFGFFLFLACRFKVRFGKRGCIRCISERGNLFLRKR